ncbi:MAG: CRISPR-associated helicase Cas3', partial [Desulfosalsimonas sp.]
ADRLDTEAFMSPDRFELRRQKTDMRELAGRFFPKLDHLVSSAAPTRVNRLRRRVLEECQAAAEQTPGLFSLTVPTGGGKTLSSLAFALCHARKQGLRRIIYVMPYMSIIEQNAEVFRSFLGDDAVLEHHSSFDYDAAEEAERAELNWAKLAAENWDAPLIATTSVQFFESLFSSRPGRCRKLHNIANSVIILDEAQMLPRHLLLPCLEILRELTAEYGVSVVLCTATQPALSRRDDFARGLQGVREIVSDIRLMHSELKRVRVENLDELTDEELARHLQKSEQVLCITNTRGHARELYEAISRNVEFVYHLSASMCPVHRREKLRKIREALRLNRPCRVVSTQLVEAGVDVDFPVVYRAAAGIDSLAQAAGRCDREGRLTEKYGIAAGEVYVFHPEKGLPPGHFRITADTTEEVMRHHEDPLAPEAVEMYFRQLFWRAGSELDKRKILEKLEEDVCRGNIPFREISSLFKMIEEEKESVVIPLDEQAEELVRSLPYAAGTGGIMRRLQPYTVQVHSRWLNNLIDHGAVETVAGVVPVLRNMDIYSPDIGLCPEDPGFRNAENLIV